MFRSTVSNLFRSANGSYYGRVKIYGKIYKTSFGNSRTISRTSPSGCPTKRSSNWVGSSEAARSNRRAAGNRDVSNNADSSGPRKAFAMYPTSSKLAKTVTGMNFGLLRKG